MINIIYNDYYMILAMDKEQWKELWINFDMHDQQEQAQQGEGDAIN